MLDRESACNRVFLADGVGIRFEPCSFVFKLAAAPRSTMSSPLPYCRTNQTSSDVGVIGMIAASARHRWTYRRRNGTKRKFFNDFSRARALACLRARAREKSLKNFGLVPLRCRHGRRCRARLLSSTSELVSIGPHRAAVMTLSISGQRPA